MTDAGVEQERNFMGAGRVIFALAVIAIGVQTWVCAKTAGHSLGPQYNVAPVIPWVPAHAWLAYLFGAIWVACGVGMLVRGAARPAALIFGTLLAICALILEVPKNLPAIGDIGLRTVVFEPLAIASLAWLMAGGIPVWLSRTGRWLLAGSLVVFGVDHFLALGFIATLLPRWIPWHVFWVALFGVAFIAAGISIACDVLLGWGAAGMALMFGTWVITLHVPRVLGLYGIAGAQKNPNEYSSLFIAIGLWGGFWELARMGKTMSTKAIKAVGTEAPLRVAMEFEK